MVCFRAGYHGGILENSVNHPTLEANDLGHLHTNAWRSSVGGSSRNIWPALQKGGAGKSPEKQCRYEQLEVRESTPKSCRLGKAAIVHPPASRVGEPH